MNRPRHYLAAVSCAVRLPIRVVAAAAALTFGAGSARAQAPGAEIAERARAVLADDSYQTENPSRKNPTTSPGSGGPGFSLPWPGGGSGQGSNNGSSNGEGREATLPNGRSDESPSSQGGEGNDDRDRGRSDPGENGSDRADPAGTGDERGEPPGGPGGSRESNGGTHPSEKREWSLPAQRRHVPPPPLADAGGPSIFGFVALSLIGAVLVLLLVLGATQFLRSRAREDEDDEPDREEPTAENAKFTPVAAGDVEALAREGRFAEAVHALFQITVNMLARDGRLVLEDAMTGRETLGRARMDDSARAALRELVGMVEYSLFGGGAVGPDQYQRCAASFRLLASTSSTAGALRGAPVGPPTLPRLDGTGS